MTEPRTRRLRLRQWRDSDLAPFAALNADVEVMEHFPARLTLEQSDALAAREQARIAACGWGLWAVEVGWRLARPVWGRGYETEAADVVVRFAFASSASTSSSPSPSSRTGAPAGSWNVSE